MAVAKLALELMNAWRNGGGCEFVCVADATVTAEYALTSDVTLASIRPGEQVALFEVRASLATEPLSRAPLFFLRNSLQSRAARRKVTPPSMAQVRELSEFDQDMVPQRRFRARMRSGWISLVSAAGLPLFLPVIPNPDLPVRAAGAFFWIHRVG
jgi:hypothetical protein